MEGCCESLVKYFMVLCNVLFALAGCVLIGFGAYTQLEAKDYLNFLGDNYVNTPIFIIIVGLVIFVVSFFGCCGALKEKKFLIYIYATIIFLILVAQIGAAIAAFVLKGDVEGAINKNMNNGMMNYGKPEFEGVTTTWDIVQKEYKCCGVNNATDWAKQPAFETNQAPDSCCQSGQVEGCGKDEKHPFFPDGCFAKFKGDFVDNLGIVGGVALGIAVIEILAVIFACYLGKRVDGGGQFV